MPVLRGRIWSIARDIPGPGLTRRGTPSSGKGRKRRARSADHRRVAFRVDGKSFRAAILHFDRASSWTIEIAGPRPSPSLAGSSRARTGELLGCLEDSLLSADA